jgi:hypothetical protein
MRISVLCFALIALPTLAQTPSKTANQQAVSRRGTQSPLKDEFAKSSLRALRMIQGETSAFTVGQDGSLLVPRVTQDVLDNLDADAQTKTEQAVVGVLNTFFIARLTHNTFISDISAKINLSLSGKQNEYLYMDEDQRALMVSGLASKDLAVAEMRNKELACSTQLEATLRSRRFRELPA